MTPGKAAARWDADVTWAGNADLARRLAAGDLAAEDELIAKFDPPLRTMLRRRVKDASLAEDLCQETFRIALGALRQGRLRYGDKLAGYLWGIAERLAVRTLRLRRRECFDAAVTEHPDQAPTPEQAAVSSEQVRLIRSALERLSSRDRLLLHTFYLGGQSKADICRRLTLTPAQFDVVKFRALKRLTTAWRPGVRPGHAS